MDTSDEGPELDRRWAGLGNNVSGVLHGCRDASAVAARLVGAGWSSRSSSWCGYELETDWCRIEVDPAGEPEVLLNGVVDPDRIGELGRLLDRFGIPHELELDDGDGAPVCESRGRPTSEQGEDVPMEPLVHVPTEEPHLPTEDPHFGAIAIELDHAVGALTVRGTGLPTVEMRRAPGTPPDGQVPIGTRDPERLTLTVDGTEETLRPAKGFLTRRSYRVEATSTTRGHTYRLVPDSLATSRLLRDGRLLGVFTSSGDGHVTADWETPDAPARPPEPYDASMGYALAAAFGTGAEPMWRLVLDAVLDLWP
ncbi:hypothetical protein [Streptomyces sp. WAC08241]|uniref:hypothetical protein n=1 Tax=Streptomyces sp. WAC08241 TaxID=2487421 RepID=UPI0026CABAB7|nr:hypothetical protein [Streptomyces sp. WAC08241]